MDGTQIIVAGISIVTIFFIMLRMHERSSMSDRQKAKDIIKEHQIPENLELLLRDIVYDNYYGALNSATHEKNSSEYANDSLTTYSFIFSGTKISLTLRGDYRQTLYLKINNELFIVLYCGHILEEYHHNHQSLKILKKIFVEVQKNQLSRLAEQRKRDDSDERQKYTFKRN